MKQFSRPEITFLKNFRKLLSFFSKKQKISGLWITLLQIIGVIFEVFGLGMVLPIIISIINYEQLISIPQVNEILVYFNLPSEEKVKFTLFAFLLLAAAVLKKRSIPERASPSCGSLLLLL